MKNKASLLLAIVCAILIVIVYTNSSATNNTNSKAEKTVDATAPVADSPEENIPVVPEIEVYESIQPLENEVSDLESIHSDEAMSIPAPETSPITLSGAPEPSGIVLPSEVETEETIPESVVSQLLVNCDNEMVEGNEYNILACVFQEDIKAQIVKEIAELNHVSVEEVVENSKVKSVTTTDKYTVTIVYDNKDFELLSGETSFIGSIKNKKQWFEWIVKPISTGANKHISITVENIDEEGNKYALIPAERIKIDVAVDKSGFIDNMWIQIRDNAEWTITVLIIPIVTYLVGLFKRRKEDEEPEA